ncbi:MAG: substrate-binding domain-containing protein [Chloroflexi bacterium]|nr:substrate-binding domain-containing protein [Chloroflexota bacterium]
MSVQRKYSRRQFLGIAAATGTGLALAACAQGIPQAPAPAGGGATAPAAQPQPAAAATINMWGWTDLVNTDVVTKFTDKTGIKVNLSELGDAVFGDQKFLTAVSAGTGPDVAIQNRHTFMQFAAKKLYQDVTPLMDGDDIKVDDFAPVQIKETMWQGKVYGLPMMTDVRYLYWNRAHFQEVGLDPTKPPTTWTELEAYTDKLVKKTSDGKMDRYGFVPYLYGNSWMWLYGFLNKAPAISDDKRTILCDDPKWAEALTWMVNFYDKHVGSFELANAFSDTLGKSGMGEPFSAGKVSMSASGDWQVGDFLRKPDLDWDAAPMPIPDGGVKSTWSCGWSVVMAPQSKHQKEAWELMKWHSLEDGWHARAEAAKADTQRVWDREKISGEPKYWPTQAVHLPSLQMLEKEYVSLLGDREKKAWAMGMDALKNWTHGCGTEMGVAALEYWVNMDNSVRSALAHKMTPIEAMADCKKKVQEATDRAWKAIESQG